MATENVNDCSVVLLIHIINDSVMEEKRISVTMQNLKNNITFSLHSAHSKHHYKISE